MLPNKQISIRGPIESERREPFFFFLKKKKDKILTRFEFPPRDDHRKSDRFRRRQSERGPLSFYRQDCDSLVLERRANRR